MKISCEIIQDLLPLYEDNMCSPASRAAVEEHLCICPSCRAKAALIRDFAPPETVNQAAGEDQAVAKSFRKVRRCWKASLLASLLVIPLLLLSINQIRGQGICFTNVDEILVARRYVYALEQGNFEAAAACTNYQRQYDELRALVSMTPAEFHQEIYQSSPSSEKEALEQYQYIQERYAAVADMTLEEYTDFVGTHYAQDLQHCTDQGFSFKGTGYQTSYFNPESKYWTITYGVQVTSDTGSYPMSLDISVLNGEAAIWSIGHKDEFPGADTVIDALFMHYPD